MTRTFEKSERGRKGREIPKLAVEFQFKGVDGTPVRDREDLPASSDIGPGDELEIRYFPDEEKSARVAGTESGVWPLIFFGTLLATAGAVWNIAREANAPVGR